MFIVRSLMILLYNVLLSVCLFVLLPVALLRAKRRGRIVERLGLKSGWIAERLACVRQGPVVWIHALSVGEVVSAVPLVKAVRDNIRPAVIVFTAATRSGRMLAEELVGPHADLVLSSQLDFRFSVRCHLAAIRPSLFILVETDFWPNWLDQIRRHRVPAMLVNGRMSEKSFAVYARLAFFFRPMFDCFSLLSMQTDRDRNNMIKLGIPEDKVAVLGNLKYDLPAHRSAAVLAHPALAKESGKAIWVCGSTHPGEEELLFSAFREVGIRQLLLVVAPRRIERSNELVQVARRFGLAAELRSSGNWSAERSVLVLDTFGELAACYSSARLAFVGGSLVAEGGHNPLEPAVHGVPVLFGPHMEDFSEIARDLVSCGGAMTVAAEGLAKSAASILADEELHAAMSRSGRALVEQQRGSVDRHVHAVRMLLEQRSADIAGLL